MSSSTFLRVVAALFAVCCLVSLFFSYRFWLRPDVPQWWLYFFTAIAVFYLVGSIGLVNRSILGYYALLVFLSVLLVSFPIGTVLAVRTLRYMKRNSVRSLFG